MNCSLCGGEAHLVVRGSVRLEPLPSMPEEHRKTLGGYAGETVETPFCVPCLIASRAENERTMQQMKSTGAGAALVDASREILEH